MSQKLRLILGLTFLLTVCTSCSSPTHDSGNSDDIEVEDARDIADTITSDGDDASDIQADKPSDNAGPDGGDGEVGDTATGDTATCSGDCAVTDLLAGFSNSTAELSRAAYGLSAPSAPGEAWTLYVEAWDGGFVGCPAMDSPTPDRAIVLSGIQLPFEDNVATADGVSLSLFDYAGSLLTDQPLATASNAEVQPVLVSVCVDCVGQPEPSDADGFVALQLSATFDGGGSLSGQVYAVHCDSLDLGM